MSREYSPNGEDITCPECSGSFHYVGTQSGSHGQYDLYYCDNNVEFQSMVAPDEVVGSEDEYCDGIVHVHENGRVTVGAGDDLHVVREGETA